MTDQIEGWKKLVGVHPDFPKTGINFLDISPLLANPIEWYDIIDHIGDEASLRDITHVLGLDARGFIVGSSVANELFLPFVMARKPGKLPGDLHTVDYDLEYGSNSLSIQKDAFPKGAQVAIIDDLLATGGSVKAAIDLVRAAGAIPTFVGCLIELTDLRGREKFSDIPFHSVMQF